MGAHSAIIMISINLALSAIWARFFFKVATPRPGWRGRWYTVATLLVIYSCGIMLIYSSIAIKMLVNLLALLVVLKFCFSLLWGVGILLASVSLLSIVVSEIVAIFLFVALTDSNTYMDIIASPPIHIALSCINVLIAYFLMEFAISVLKKNHFLRQSKVSRFAWLPVSHYVSIFSFFVFSIERFSGQLLQRCILLGSFALVAFFIIDAIILNTVPRIIESSRQEELEHITGEERAHLVARYNQLEIQQAELRNLRHDIVNHCSTFHTMLERGDFSGAKEYGAKLLIHYHRNAN